jgi:hypothetical protein
MIAGHIGLLVPGRTKQGVDETTARVGTWTPDEDSELKDAVKKRNGKKWADIAALVTGRTNNSA